MGALIVIGITFIACVTALVWVTRGVVRDVGAYMVLVWRYRRQIVAAVPEMPRAVAEIVIGAPRAVAELAIPAARAGGQIMLQLVGLCFVCVMGAALIWLIAATWSVTMWVFIIAAGIVLGGLILGAMAGA